MASKDKILVIGASGQIGTELTLELRSIYGNAQVVTADIRPPHAEVTESGPHEQLNILDIERIYEVIQKHKITQMYHLAAILSATGESHPKKAWSINMEGLMNVLDACSDTGVQKLFWPSSIAVFGKRTPKRQTPQYTITDPQTVYGISKLAGERWCHYYHHNKGLDIRSIRYPGIISYKSEPGGGTTDYAVDIFFKAISEGKYDCYLNEDSRLPMMYMPDAIKSTIQLMESEAQQLRIHSSYNVSGMDFTPTMLANEIKKFIPDFEMTYTPDFRQEIAQTWPGSIDDNYAKVDWQWQAEYNLDSMTKDMLINVKKKLDETVKTT